MPRKQKWEVGGVTVTRSHIRLWMQSVAHRIPPRQWDYYVKNWQVPHKIAGELRRGTFHETVQRAAADAGVKLRKPRSPSTISRLRQSWPSPANDAAPAAAPASRAW